MSAWEQQGSVERTWDYSSLLEGLYRLALKSFGSVQSLPLSFILLFLRASKKKESTSEACNDVANDDNVRENNLNPDAQKKEDEDILSRFLRPAARKFAMLYDCSTPREREFLRQELSVWNAEHLVLHNIKRRRVEEATSNHHGPPLNPSGRERRRRRQRQDSKGEFSPLETQVPFSKSCMWNINENYYEASGLEAWTSNDVPYGITSSSFLADHYASVLVQFAGEQQSQLSSNPGLPMYVLDLGSGHGTFAVRLAKALRRRNASNICVIMTDFHASALLEVAKRRELQDVIGSYLNFAVVDLCKENPQYDSLQLLHGNQEPVNLWQGPLALVCNYVLDSLPPEIYRTDCRGNPEIGLCTTWPRRLSRQGQGGNVVPNISSVEIDFKQTEIQDTRVQSVLDQVPHGSTVLINATAGRALSSLIGTCAERQTLIIVADKMTESVEDVMAWHAGVPGLDQHGDAGCISCAVDPFTLECFLANDQRVRSCAARHISDPTQSLGISIYTINSPAQLISKLHHTLFGGFSVTDFDRVQGWIMGMERNIRTQCVEELGKKGIQSLLHLANYDFELFWVLKWPATILNGPKSDGILMVAQDCFSQRVPMSQVRATKEIIEMAQWYYVQGKPDLAQCLLRSLPVEDIQALRISKPTRRLFKELKL